MTQSERSRYVRVQTAWINYQKRFLGKSESELVVDPPQQFQDIFWQGHAYGMLDAKRKGK